MESFVRRVYEEHRGVNGLEIEARFGTSTNNGFVPGVSKTAFDALKRNFESSRAWERVEEVTTSDTFVEDVRNTFDERGNHVESVRKKRLTFECFDDVKICASVETSVPRALGNVSHQRKKRRKSFHIGCWRYDLTHTSSRSGDTYEVEIELCKNYLKYDAKHVSSSFVSKIRQLHDTLHCLR